MKQLARLFLYILLTLSISLNQELHAGPGQDCTCTSDCTLTSGVDVSSTSKPHGTVTKFVQGSYGNYPGISKGRPSLPIWVIISFDQEVNSDYAYDYFKFLMRFDLLKGIRMLQRNRRQEFSIQIPASVSRSYLDSILDQANRHFDPEIGRREERIALLEKQRADLAIATEKAAREAAALQKQIADKAIRLQNEEIARLKAERIALAHAEAERVRLKREHDKAIEEEREKSEQVLYPSHRVIALPENFHIIGRKPLNNQGQIAGFIASKSLKSDRKDYYKGATAAFWDYNRGLITLALAADKTIAYEINDCGFIVASMHADEHKTKFDPARGRVIVWNINTNECTFGPIGLPSGINNDNVISMISSNDRRTPIAWIPATNTIRHSTKELQSNTPNANGVVLYPDSHLSSEPSLFYNGKHHPLHLPAQILIKNVRKICDKPYLNDNNQVSAMTCESRDGNNSRYAIALWDIDGKITMYQYLAYTPELEGYTNFAIRDFNNAGQILLAASKHSNIKIEPSLFLLTPR